MYKKNDSERVFGFGYRLLCVIRRSFFDRGSSHLTKCAQQSMQGESNRFLGLISHTGRGGGFGLNER